MLEVEKNSKTTKETPFATESQSKIWVATDYSKFKLNEYNREPGHYKKVLKSIKDKDYTMYNPILVDRQMNIVDGQNRFLACKELGKPIYFIVGQDIHIFAASQINQASKNWTMIDFVQHYAKRGMEPYIKMIDLAAKYQQRLSVIAQFGKLSDNSRSHSESVSRGLFQFRTDIDVNDFFEHVATFQKYYKFAKKERFVRAVLKLYTHEDYSPKTMEKKLRIASSIVHDQPKVEMVIEELVKLYNYKSRNQITIK